MDDYDLEVHCYEDAKLKIEKYLQQQRLDKLKRKLEPFLEMLLPDADRKFSKYIKEKTGYEINLFEDLQKRIEAVLLQDDIRIEKESDDVARMLTYFDENSISGDKVEKLRLLLGNYCEIELKKENKRNVHSENTSIEEIDGEEIITETITFGPKPKHYKEISTDSQDGNCKARVSQWSDGKQSSTSVSLQFLSGAGGCVCQLVGICDDVSASWKDNSTLVISTRKDYEVMMQHKNVRSFDKIIIIEYIEN